VARTRLSRLPKVGIADLAQIIEFYAFVIFSHLTENILNLCHAINGITIDTCVNWLICRRFRGWLRLACNVLVKVTACGHFSTVLLDCPLGVV